MTAKINTNCKIALRIRWHIYRVPTHPGNVLHFYKIRKCPGKILLVKKST